LETGEALDLFKEARPADPQPGEELPDDQITEKDELMALVKVSQGEMGLYMLYQTTAPEEIDNLFSSLPRFKFRQTIERDESGGADRVMAIR
jgi:hypothetical protein